MASETTVSTRSVVDQLTPGTLPRPCQGCCYRMNGSHREREWERERGFWPHGQLPAVSLLGEVAGPVSRGHFWMCKRPALGPLLSFLFNSFTETKFTPLKCMVHRVQ